MSVHAVVGFGLGLLLILKGSAPPRGSAFHPTAWDIPDHDAVGLALVGGYAVASSVRLAILQLSGDFWIGPDLAGAKGLTGEDEVIVLAGSLSWLLLGLKSLQGATAMMAASRKHGAASAS